MMDSINLKRKVYLEDVVVLRLSLIVLLAPPKKVHKCFSHMKTLELEIVQGFFFLPSLRIPLHICEVGFRQFSGFF